MEPTRNLLIVHTPGAQELSDWLRVKAIIEAKAPDIEVRIAENGRSNPIARKWQVRRPSLVFSPSSLVDFEPRGGTLYVGRLVAKLEQTQRLRAAGVAAPLALELLGGMVLRQDIWGEYVIVKPFDDQRGVGVRLVRTNELGTRLPALFNVGRFSLTTGSSGRFVVQQFIDHTDDKGHLVDYRVLMMGGRPLYLQWRRGKRPRRPLADLARELSHEIASNYFGVERSRKLVNDEDILDLAARASAVFPEVPVLGIDVVREHATGKLFVLEINPEGNWHLSSTNALREYTPELRRAVYHQFNALEVTADVLIEKTRRDAS